MLRPKRLRVLQNTERNLAEKKNLARWMHSLLQRAKASKNGRADMREKKKSTCLVNRHLVLDKPGCGTADLRITSCRPLVLQKADGSNGSKRRPQCWQNLALSCMSITWL